MTNQLRFGIHTAHQLKWVYNQRADIEPGFAFCPMKEQLKEQLGCVPVNPSSVKVEPKSEDTKVVTTKPRDRMWK